MGIDTLFGKKFPYVRTEKHFSFATHTTIGSGGYAALSVLPQNDLETAAVIAYLESQKIPFCFLGAGANVLPSDGFWEGAVIRFRFLRGISVKENFIETDAGVSGGELLRVARIHSLGGFEPFAGIPMTVGGGAAMNAGVKNTHFSDLVEWVEGVENGKIRRFNLRECDYSEKNSVFLQGIAITRVCLRGVKSERIAQTTAGYLAARKHLPKGRSMGCTFVNPEGKSAGELIDRCGLKGRSVGKAYISTEHANFIINEGTSSNDVSELIAIIKETVRRKTGILLREEIRRIP